MGSERRAFLLPTVLPIVLSACVSTRHSDIAALDRALAAQPSATAVLASRCRAEGSIRAERMREADTVLPPDLAGRIGTGPAGSLRLRRVRLKCDDTVMSEALNWYRADRLPAAVNVQLETSDVPFGRALAPYGFVRQRLWSRTGPAGGCPPGTVLSQSAVLELAETGPVSALIECYAKAALEPD